MWKKISSIFWRDQESLGPLDDELHLGKRLEIETSSEQEKKVESPHEVETQSQQVETGLEKDDEIEMETQRDNEFKRIDMVSDQSIHELRILWTFLLNNFMGQPKISMNKLQDLGIKFQLFDLNEPIASKEIVSKEDVYPQFFSPFDCKTLNALEPNLTSSGTKEAIDRWFKPHDEPEWLWPFPRTGSYDAQHLAYTFYVGLRILRWIDGKDLKNIKLMDDHAWKEDPGALDVLGRGGWRPSTVFEGLHEWSGIEDIWLARQKPHIMTSLWHEFNGDDETIYLVEFLVIVVLISTRLIKATFPNENIVPIMVFSFTPDSRCRILQAHIDCEQGLVIRRTIFHHLDRDKDPYMKAFLRHAASSPTGSTRDLRTPKKWFHLPE